MTLAGAVAAALALDRVTIVAAEAAALKVTVPCDEFPPITVPGFSVKFVIDGAVVEGGVTVKTALCVELP